MKTLALIPILLAAGFQHASPAGEISFRHVEIDDSVGIGYGLAIADVNGDGKDDILLVDKDSVAWYENPSWEKRVMAEQLTPRDHVCIAARDIDGDGKAEVAVGAGWNPGDTENSGAVFYLAPPENRAEKWRPIQLEHEPVVHRMHWIRNREGGFDLVVLPLHGRGNRNGQGAGVKILAYAVPDDPTKPWKTEVVDDSYHLTHNFDSFALPRDRSQEGFIVAAKEGLAVFFETEEGWNRRQPPIDSSGAGEFDGAGEVRVGRLSDEMFIAAIEPMHGNQTVIYTRQRQGSESMTLTRRVIDDSLVEGHALACGDLLGVGSDQVVVGWRAMRDPNAKVGIKMYTPADGAGEKWETTLIDDNQMACEDLKLADLDQDGRLDIIAAGRGTHNLKIYFNQGTGARR